MLKLLRYGCLLILVSLVATGRLQAATIRVSGDNAWKVYVNGELIAEGADWQAPSVTDFDLDRNGFALIAIYVHDAEPGAAGSGGMLADIILDDGSYLPTTADDPAWKCDVDEIEADRNDDWQTVAFDDSDWEALTFYEQFGAGIWGFGAAAMTAVLGDPPSEAYWCWCQENNLTDDVYFRYVIGTLDVEASGKLATSWARLKDER